jgi:superfamily II DNA helicase RecQ
MTATATNDTRLTIFEAMQIDKPRIIAESPNKDNISYVVQYLQKNVTSASSYFKWLIDKIKVYQQPGLLCTVK